MRFKRDFTKLPREHNLPLALTATAVEKETRAAKRCSHTFGCSLQQTEGHTKGEYHLNHHCNNTAARLAASTAL